MARAETTSLAFLEVEAYGPFVERQRLEFPAAGAVLLRGRNLDTGGGSGTGKTKFLQAIDMALGYSEFPATEQQSWCTESPLRLRLGLRTDAGVCSISRGQKAELELADGSKVHGKNGIDAALVKVLGTSPHILEVLTSRHQRSAGGNFLRMKNSEKQSFLAMVLDLAKYEAQVKASEDLGKSLEKKLAQAQEAVVKAGAMLQALEQTRPEVAGNCKEAMLKLQAQIQELQHEEAELEQAISAYDHEAGIYRGEKEDWTKSQYLKLQQQRQRFEEEKKAIEASFVYPVYDDSGVATAKSAIATAETMIQEAESALASAIASFRGEQALKRQRWQSLQQHLQAEPKLVEEIRVLQKKVGMLRAQYCPTCTRPWSSAEAEAMAKAVEAEILEKQESVRVNARLLPEIETLQLQLDTATPPQPDPNIARLRAVLAEQERIVREHRQMWELEVAGIRERRQQALLAHEQKVRAYFEGLGSEPWCGEARLQELERGLVSSRGRLHEVMAREALLKQEQEHLQKQALESMQRLVRHEQLLQLAKTALADAESAVEPLQQQLAAEQDFQALLGREGFLGKIFDETLQDIAAEANAILEAVPNTATVELAFVSERETDSGTVKKAIGTVITVGGHEAQFRSGLSGGMQAVVELAVDLALRTVVCRRLGLQPRWLLLDEPLEGLGEVEKGAVMDIIDRYAQQSLVIVVDHTTETKALFSKTIDIEHRGGVSVIKGIG
ncbi:MAG: hypothetical protein KGL39_40620 [Patescibacteria group bacterium]|nr:hypothetical protein [Patescibacteria group bacterium]